MEGHVYPAFHSPSFHAHAVDLSVDAETGEVTIHRYVVAQDVGFAMNPTYIEGQIEGGVAQGLGQTLSEEIVYRDGRVLNANLTDYKMPTTLDVPRIESILVEHPGRVGPFGAKGVGEPPNIEPPAAVANAIAAAVGDPHHEPCRSPRRRSFAVTRATRATGAADAPHHRAPRAPVAPGGTPRASWPSSPSAPATTTCGSPTSGSSGRSTPR